MLGLLYGHTPKFAKKYAQIENVAQSFAHEVRVRKFPSREYLYQQNQTKAQKKVS